MTPRELKPYLEAQRLRREEQNFFCWLQGAYFCNAMSVVVSNAFSQGKKIDYFNEPIRLTPLTEKEKEEQKEKETQRLISYLNSFKTNFEKREAAI